MQQPTYFIVYSVQSCDTQEPTFGRPPGTEFSTSGGESRGAEGVNLVSGYQALTIYGSACPEGVRTKHLANTKQRGKSKKTDMRRRWPDILGITGIY